MTQIAMPEPPNGDYERTVGAHIDAAGRLLHGEGAVTLVALLFGRAAPEDVILYEPAELAVLAQDGIDLRDARLQ